MATPRTCLIIGGGIAGTAAALALSHIGIKCTIYELRSKPASGGFVNLTPNALRLLQYLNVSVSGCPVEQIEIFSYHTGKKLGELPFKKFGNALRVMREELHNGLMRALEAAAIPMICGAKLVSLVEKGDKLVASYSDGTEAQGDFILGCDGMHSVVRTGYVEPDRESIYTGVAAASALVNAEGVERTHFQQTAANSGRFGTLLTSYVDPDKSEIYLAAVMEAVEQKSRDEWKTRGKDHEKTLKEVNRIYKDAQIPCLMRLIERVDAFTFYPVYKLGQRGKWYRRNVMLLGDAAHGMPPQGESTGLALEDAVLIARILGNFPEKPISYAFDIYEKTRRPRIDKAYKESASRWERVKDKSWLEQKAIEKLTPAFLRLNKNSYEKSFTFDVTTQPLAE